MHRLFLERETIIFWSFLLRLHFYLKPDPAVWHSRICVLLLFGFCSVAQTSNYFWSLQFFSITYSLLRVYRFWLPSSNWELKFRHEPGLTHLGQTYRPAWTTWSVTWHKLAMDEFTARKWVWVVHMTCGCGKSEFFSRIQIPAFQHWGCANERPFQMGSPGPFNWEYQSNSSKSRYHNYTFNIVAMSELPRAKIRVTGVVRRSAGANSTGEARCIWKVYSCCLLDGLI